MTDVVSRQYILMENFGIPGPVIVPCDTFRMSIRKAAVKTPDDLACDMYLMCRRQKCSRQTKRRIFILDVSMRH